VVTSLVVDEPRGEHTSAAVTDQKAALEKLVWHQLRSVKDPEIPVLDVVEMGIARAVEVALDSSSQHPSDPPTWRVRVTITPTFSACPALHAIERDVRETTERTLTGFSGSDGAGQVEVVTTLTPPWTSDDMSAEAREKLERFGIAPAPPHGGLLLPALEAPVRCPRCGHPDTRVRNTFGSTLCREIRSCNSCQETFERFKPI